MRHTERERERERERVRERQRHRQREKRAPCREPDVGLDPGTPGSFPGLKAALNPWATRAACYSVFSSNATQAGLFCSYYRKGSLCPLSAHYSVPFSTEHLSLLEMIMFGLFTCLLSLLPANFSSVASLSFDPDRIIKN